MLTSVFHSFESDHLVVGILFSSEKHSNRFFKYVSHSLSHILKTSQSYSYSQTQYSEDSTKVFQQTHTHLIHRIQCGLVADLGSFLFLLVENPLLPESPNRSTCHKLLGSFLRRLSPPLALLLPLQPSQHISRKAFLLPSSLPRFLRFPPKV